MQIDFKHSEDASPWSRRVEEIRFTKENPGARPVEVSRSPGGIDSVYITARGSHMGVEDLRELAEALNKMADNIEKFPDKKK